MTQTTLPGQIPSTIIVTTADSDSRFLERFWTAVEREQAFDAVEVLVLPSRATPDEFAGVCGLYRARGLRIDSPTPRQQGDFLARRGVVGIATPGGAGRRNIGYLMALERGPEVIVSASDDVLWDEEEDELLLQTRALAGLEDTLRISAPVLRVNDSDAFAALDLTHDVAVHRDVAPSLYEIDPALLPAGSELAAEARTLSGYLCQACVRHMGDQLGSPAVRLTCDEDATPGTSRIAAFGRWLAEVPLDGVTYAQTYHVLASVLEDATQAIARDWPYAERAALRRIARVMRVWCRACERIESGGSAETELAAVA